MTPTIHSETQTSSGPLAPSPAIEYQLAALLAIAATHPLDNGWIRVTGEDRVRWLNGMVTNSISDLQTGQGNYNFFLNAQGRIQGDACIFAEPDALLIETSNDQIAPVIAHLDHFIIMDDVELTDISATRPGLLVAGPHASSLLHQLQLPVPDLAPLQTKTVAWNSANVIIIHAHSPVVPRYELWSDPTTIAALSKALSEAGAIPSDPAAIEALRILEGTPRYGIDIRNSETARDLPQETAQTRALHFSKGCYLGQEIVERIHSRGNVHRTFTGFRLNGALPAAGTFLTSESDSKPLGELTSVAAILLHGTPTELALGYIRREAVDRGTPLNYPGGQAIPVSLPFTIPAAG
jgi:folate-binding protein YgfZ